MKNKKDVAIVDVDEILWSFSTALYNVTEALRLNFPKPYDWTHWDIFWEYAPKEKMFPIFELIHSNQCNFKPYSYSKVFLEYMYNNYYVIIASHRNPELKTELINWLNMHELKYDEVDTSYDKTRLFKRDDVKVVIDDRDETLAIARDHKKIALGLRKPWNERSKLYVDYLLYNSLHEIKCRLIEINEKKLCKPII